MVDSFASLLMNCAFTSSYSPISFSNWIALLVAPFFVILFQSFRNWASDILSLPLVFFANWIRVYMVSSVIFHPKIEVNLMHLHTATGCLPYGMFSFMKSVRFITWFWMSY